MSGVSGLLGFGGGAAGTGFSGPSGTNQGQLDTAQSNVQNSIQQQQQFLNALAAQNGVSNQSQVYKQLQDVVAGKGPNPAQAALAQATAANVANQGALAAGQRGSAANTGLLARQAAQQGANLQQQSAGQAATMQANQSLNALTGAGNLANTQVGQQQTGLNTLGNMSQGNQSALLGLQGNINEANAGLAGKQLGGQQQLIGGLLNGAGSAMMADGGGVVAPTAPATAAPSPGPKSAFAKHMFNMGDPNALQQGASNFGAGLANAFKSKPVTIPQGQEIQMPAANESPEMHAAEGGKVPAMVSPGEQYLAPEDVEKVKSGANPMKTGEKIPGKPKVSGAKNDYANDTVPKTLEEGGIVIPRSVTQSKNPHWEAMKFVHATLKKNRHK